MTFLLAEIGLSLALAALAGWYVGWTWRGFRDQDVIEDARRTFHATQEVKDRDLSEAYRRAESLQAQLDSGNRRIGDLERRVAETSPRPGRAQEHPPGRREPLVQPVRTGNLVRLESVDAGKQEPARATSGRLEAEVQLRQEAEAALRERAAALTAARAEADSLRASIETRAEQVATLEARVIEMESSAGKLTDYERRVSSLRADLVRSQELAAHRAHEAEAAAAERARLEEKIAERDRALNEARNRHNDTIASLQERHGIELNLLRDQVAALEARVSEPNGDTEQLLRTAERERERARDEIVRCSAILQRLESDLEEAERKLQRQIERNRRLEAVHRHELQELRRILAEQPESETRAAAAGEGDD